MNLLKDNFKLIFVVVTMLIIAIGTLIYDVNKPSLSANNIIQIDDTAIISVYENVNLVAGISDLEGVEFVCSVDNEEVATVSNCNVVAHNVGNVNAKITVKSLDDGEVLDEKIVAITVNKAKMNVTNIPNELELEVGDEYSLKPNTNGVEVTIEYEYDETMFKVIKNETGPDSLVALKEGNSTFKILFTSEDSKYESAQSTINIKVKKIVEPTISVNDIDMTVGETKEVDVSTNDIVGSLSLTSDDNTILNIEGMNVTALKVGMTIVTVTFNPEDTDKYKPTTKKFKVNVSAKELKSEIDIFVDELKPYIKDNDKVTINYDRNTNIFSTSYCENGCTDTSNKTIVNFKYDETFGILRLINSISTLNNDMSDLSNEYSSVSPIINYILDKFDVNKTLLNDCFAEEFKSGINSCALSIKNNGLIYLYGDYSEYSIRRNDKIYMPKTLKNLEIDIKNGIKSDSNIYKIKTNAQNGSVLVDNIKNISGKDIVTLKIKANSKYGFDTLTIKNNNGKDITKDVNYNNNYMTFEMPSSDVVVNATFITNVKTGVNDLTMLLAITMVVFGLGLYIVRKNVNSLEI